MMSIFDLAVKISDVLESYATLVVEENDDSMDYNDCAAKIWCTLRNDYKFYNNEEKDFLIGQVYHTIFEHTMASSHSIHDVTTPMIKDHFVEAITTLFNDQYVRFHLGSVMVETWTKLCKQWWNLRALDVVKANDEDDEEDTW